MRALGSAASVVEAVREETESEVERHRRELETELNRLRSAAGQESLSPPDREALLQAARREASERFSREDWADRREALEEREAWISGAVAEGRRRLAQMEDSGSRREFLSRLAREALERLPGESFQVAVSPSDAAILDQAWCEELARGRGKREVRLALEGERPASGCVVRTADGRVSFDNSFEARSRRFEAAWRAALAEIYPS